MKQRLLISLSIMGGVILIIALFVSLVLIVSTLPLMNIDRAVIAVGFGPALFFIVRYIITGKY